jgi:hypothetical protein
MLQLLCHLWGDYILQSDWMAQNKTKANLPAVIHAALYSATFLLLHPSGNALTMIFVTHYVIDRLRLARYVVYVKNWMSPPVKWFFESHDQFGVTPPPLPHPGLWTNVDRGKVEHAFRRQMPPLSACPTGYPPETPAWMAVWLLIIVDTVLHLTINFLALRFL